MGVGVVVEGLTPAVQHGGDPDPDPEGERVRSHSSKKATGEGRGLARL